MPDLFVSTAARPRRRLRRALGWLALLAGLLALGAVAVAANALAERGKAPAGTTVAGVDVGGMNRDEARKAAAAAAGGALARSIRLIGPGGEAGVTGADLRARPLLEEALDRALSSGPLERALRRLGMGGTRTIELRYRLGAVRVAQLADGLDRRFGERPRSASLRLGRGGVRIEPPAPGRAVDRGALREALSTLPAEVGLRLRIERPAVGMAAARRAAGVVSRLLERPRSVRLGAARVPLGIGRLRSLVRVTPARSRLEVRLDAARLRQALLPGLGRFERAPRDARFAVDGARVRVVPSAPGRRLDGAAIAASLVRDPGAAVHGARFVPVQPRLDTAAARRLRITEPISEFTTNYPCCQPRVTNIRRAAELLDGTIVRPGGRFSLNAALGERTIQNGFVSAPQIYDGRFEDAVGGGISQVSTTLYNAAFFAGVELVAHQPHQFYISRYPMGREATISWGGPEMIFRNDWSAAILIKLYAGDTGITVRFYSTRLGRRVETTTGSPYAVTTPRTITVKDPSLPPGTRRLVQRAGDRGFSVSYTRVVYRGAKRIRNERYLVRYDPENAIVEVGPPRKPKPKPKPQPKPPAGSQGQSRTSAALR